MSLLGMSSGQRAWTAIVLLLATGLAADGAVVPSSEVATFALSNDGGALPERTVSFGQIFRPGTVGKQDQLQAVIGGAPVATQIDAKALNSDGSVRHAIVSVQLPRLSSGQRLAGTLIKGTQSTPAAGEFASVPQLDVVVTLKTKNAPDKPVPLNLLSIAEAAKETPGGTWIDGPLARERRFTASVNGNLQVLFDVFTPRGGPARADVIFRNDWTGTRKSDTVTYDVEIRVAGAVRYQARDVQHHPFTVWHKQFWTDGGADIRMVPSLALLQAAGAIPRYDPQFRIAGRFSSDVARGVQELSDKPLDSAMITKYMPQTGGRMDIGPLPTWAALDLLAPTASSRKAVLANGDAAGAVPWHVRSRKNGQPLSIDEFPQLWLDSRGEPVAGALPESFDLEHDGWTLDDAHQPSLSYLPYLLTGSQYYRDELAHQAAFVLLMVPGPGYRGGNAGLIMGKENESWEQVRALAWSLRTLANAAFILPANDPMRGYFDAKLKGNLAKMVQIYIQDGTMKSTGALEGWVPGAYEPPGVLAPWQQGFLAIVLNWTNDMGYRDAGNVVGWMSNFITGLFTNSDQGFDPDRGAAYNVRVFDPEKDLRFKTWTEAFEGDGLNKRAGNLVEEDWKAYGNVMQAGVGAAYAVTRSPRAKQAYEFVRNRASEVEARYRGDPTFAIVPFTDQQAAQ